MDIQTASCLALVICLAPKTAGIPGVLLLSLSEPHEVNQSDPLVRIALQTAHHDSLQMIRYIISILTPPNNDTFESRSSTSSWGTFCNSIPRGPAQAKHLCGLTCLRVAPAPIRRSMMADLWGGSPAPVPDILCTLASKEYRLHPPRAHPIPRLLLVRVYTVAPRSAPSQSGSHLPGRPRGCLPV